MKYHIGTAYTDETGCVVIPDGAIMLNAETLGNLAGTRKVYYAEPMHIQEKKKKK
jgi:hypothetical protein